MKRWVPILLLAALATAAVMFRPRWTKAAGPPIPRRIVSIVPSSTEFLYAVGAGDQVVGVTSYCLYPPEARSKEIIGNMHLSFERILALKPDLVVSSEDIAAKSNEHLRGMGLRVLCLDPRNLADIAGALRTLGRETGHVPEAERAAAEFEMRVADVERRLRTATAIPSVYLEATSQPHAAAPGTAAHEVIVKARGRNIITESFAGKWIPISWETVLARDPDVIVWAHEYPPLPPSRPGWDGLSAVKAGRAHAFEKDHFMFPTPRLAGGLERLARVVHPECFDEKAR